MTDANDESFCTAFDFCIAFMYEKYTADISVIVNTSQGYVLTAIKFTV